MEDVDDFHEDNSDFFGDAAKDVFQTFLRCPIQDLAYRTILADILKCDMMWSTSVGKREYTVDIEDSHEDSIMWKQFTAELVREFLVFGFAYYRLKQNNRNKKTKKKHAPVPQVASGMNISLSWDENAYRWRAVDSSGHKLSEENGWKVLFPTHPERIGTANFPIFRSCAAIASPFSKLRTQMYVNIGKRDERNTSIEVYAQTVKSINKSQTGTGSQEWFQSAVHGSMSNSAPGDIFQPLETMIADRLDVAIELKKMSDKIRSLDDGMPTQKSLKVRHPEQSSQEHREHFVTDGREAREISFRRAPEDIMRILDELFIEILFSYNVMPQVVGKNINSERIAAGNRMAEVSIERYSEFVKQLRNYVQVAIKFLSSTASGDADTYVKLVPCVTSHSLKMVESVLKPEVAIKLNSCVYDVPEDSFDIEKMKAKQMAVVTNPKASREPLTEDQKDANMKAKNDV